MYANKAVVWTVSNASFRVPYILGTYSLQNSTIMSKHLLLAAEAAHRNYITLRMTIGKAIFTYT